MENKWIQITVGAGRSLDYYYIQNAGLQMVQFSFIRFLLSSNYLISKRASLFRFQFVTSHKNIIASKAGSRFIIILFSSFTS